MRRPFLVLAMLVGGVVLSACSGGGVAGGATPAAAGSASGSGSAGGGAPSASASPTAAPAPLPPYAIEALRARVRVPGTLSVGAAMPGEPGYAKHAVAWSSAGSTLTGVLDVPTGAGPFPVVIVNHGYVPASQYYVGQDSNKYADPFASAGFVTVSPNYPGYAGSGPGTPGVPPIVAEAISDMDLISALGSLPAADNARKWWVPAGGSGTGGLPSPDQDPTAYALMSPRGHLPAAGPPTLVMQGTQDEDIPAAWTSATMAALQGAGIRSQFVSFPGATHNFVAGDLARANSLAISWLRDSLGR